MALARCTRGTVSPRLGVTAKLSTDGRTILRASYGRIHQGILMERSLRLTRAVTPDHDHGLRSRDRRLHAPRVGSRFHAQCADRSRHALATDATSIRRHRSRARPPWPWRSPTSGSEAATSSATPMWGASIARNTRILPDGRSLPVFVLVNSTADRRFLLTNPDGYSLTYHGLVIAVDKRWSHGWQAFGSYTYSRGHGLQVSSGTTAGGAQSSTVAPIAPS